VEVPRRRDRGQFDRITEGTAAGPEIGKWLIIQLPPMDIIRIDGLGAISPVSDPGGHKYIRIAVDYFTQYAWARALPAINGSAVVEMERNITQSFGLPRSVYTDNATYVVSGLFPDFLTARGIRQFLAHKAHTSSV